jgi:hypothetical protein
LERGLDSGDELRGLRVDNVPAERYAADDLPGVRGYRRRLGYTRDCRRKVLVRLLDTPEFQRLLRQSPSGLGPVRRTEVDHVENRSILYRPDMDDR